MNMIDEHLEKKHKNFAEFYGTSLNTGTGAPLPADTPIEDEEDITEEDDSEEDDELPDESEDESEE